LEPLSFEETQGYIEKRVTIVGGKSDVIFPARTVDAIYRHSRGIPRLINTICENALVSGYAKQMPFITPEVVDEIARDFRLNVVRPAEAEKGTGLDENDLQRAARMLLDLYSTIQKPLAHESQPPAPVAARFRQA
jgi:general secretion pathway protein A